LDLPATRQILACREDCEVMPALAQHLSRMEAVGRNASTVIRRVFTC
jgi:hypothetical protein